MILDPCNPTNMATEYSRRVKWLRVTPEYMVDLFKNSEPLYLSFEGVPPDAKVVRVDADAATNILLVLVESESFEVVPYGNVVESLRVTVTRHYPSK